ncbi:MAG: glucosamine-6-phosphate deaminase [Bacillota bacterium]|mgnify:CR=1 FL=1|jgi:glucosamine-6-phosphate deaminase|nr:glucosamine-6-phosphate deaminase [Bacillota bacterium]
MSALKFTVDRLNVEVHENRRELGKAAAAAVGARMKEEIARKGKVNVVFASAPSQNEFLEELKKDADIDWSKVVAFHMDEYIGIPGDAEQSFAKFLDDHLFNEVRPAEFHRIDGNSPDIEAECQRYAELLQKHGIDIVCLGIGENGHLAFNDPPVADFEDPKWVKVVELEERCRQQQVNDGAFPTLDEVPRIALTMTIPALMSAKWAACMVPGPRKQQAVRDTLAGPISKECPASALRRHPAATLFLDRDAAELWLASKKDS